MVSETQAPVLDWGPHTDILAHLPHLGLCVPWRSMTLASSGGEGTSDPRFGGPVRGDTTTGLGAPGISAISLQKGEVAAL